MFHFGCRYFHKIATNDERLKTKVKSTKEKGKRKKEKVERKTKAKEKEKKYILHKDYNDFHRRDALPARLKKIYQEDYNNNHPGRRKASSAVARRAKVGFAPQ